MNQRDAASERAALASRRDVAVYLDFENLYVSLKTTAKMDPNFELLMERCREFGRVILARAYADWSEYSRMFTSQMFANGFEPVYVPTRKVYDSANRSEARKNSVDIHITIDIIKSLFLHESVDTLILISGDRDYVPLINEIRQKGKSVFAIGVAGCTSSELSIAVDEMFFYHQLLANEEDKEPETVDVYNQILSAIRIARRRGYPTTLGILKPIMKELIQNFDERSYKNARGVPFQKFKDIVQEGERRRLVKLVTVGGTSEVLLWAEPEERATPIARPSGQRPAPAARTDGAPGRGRRGRRGGSAERRNGSTPAEPTTSGADSVETIDIAPEGAANQSAEAFMDLPSLPEPVDDDVAHPSAPAYDDAVSARDGEDDRFQATVGDDRGHDDGEASRAADDDQDHGEEAAEIGRTLELEEAWPVVQQAVQGFGARPPTPRKLIGELQRIRGDGGFGSPSPSDGNLDDLLKKCVESGRLRKERKGFSTVLKLV